MTTPPSAKDLLLVTGSSGLIGTRVQEALVSAFRIVGLDVKPPAHPVAGVEWRECDLTSDQSVREALAWIRDQHGRQIASVVHLAAYYDFSGEPSPLYETLTVQGTRRLIEGLQSFDVEQFIFSSSLLVMKPANEPGQRLTEADPTRAEWDYPRSKLEAEKVLREHRGRIPVVILRMAGVYDDACHSLPIGQHIRRIYERQLEGYVYPGDPARGQPFVHLEDLVACLHRAILVRRELGMLETFLVGEPDVMSYGELQERLGQLIHGQAWPTLRIPKPMAKAGAWIKEKLPGADPFIKPWMIDLADEHYPVEIQRARERLRWVPTHQLSESLEAMVTALQRNPRAWYATNNLPWPHEQELTADTRG